MPWINLTLPHGALSKPVQHPAMAIESSTAFPAMRRPRNRALGLDARVRKGSFDRPVERQLSLLITRKLPFRSPANCANIDRSVALARPLKADITSVGAFGNNGQDLTHAPQQTTAARPLEPISAEEPG